MITFIGYSDVAMASQVSSDLADALEDGGLDGTYWADIFKKRLYMTKPSQIKHLIVSDLELLLPDARLDWEKRALRTFLETTQRSQETTQVGVLSHTDKCIGQSDEGDRSVKQTKKADIKREDTRFVTTLTFYPSNRPQSKGNLYSTAVASTRRESPVDKDKEPLISLGDKNKQKVPPTPAYNQFQPINKQGKLVVSGKQQTKSSDIVDVNDKDKSHSPVPMQLKLQPVNTNGQRTEQSVEPNKQDTDLQPGPARNDASAPSIQQEDLSLLPCDRNTNQSVVFTERSNVQGVDQTLVSIEDNTKQPLVPNEQEQLVDTNEEVINKDNQNANLDAAEKSKMASGQSTEQPVEPNKQDTDLQPGPGQHDASPPSTEEKDPSPIPYDHNTNESVIPAERGNGQGIDQTLVSIEDNTKQPLLPNEQEQLVDTAEEVRNKDGQTANLDAVEERSITLEATRGHGQATLSCTTNETGPEIAIENIHKLTGKPDNTKQDKGTVLFGEKDGASGPALDSQVRMQASVKEIVHFSPRDYDETLEKLGLDYWNILKKLNTDLKEMFHRSRLEEEYWTTVFQTKLGISTTSQLQALCFQGLREGWVQAVVEAARQKDERRFVEQFFHEVKISLWDVMKLENGMKMKDTADLPWKMLQNLVMMNYRARDKLVSNLNTLTTPKSTPDLFDVDNSEDDDEVSSLHPMDVLLVTFGCCDRFLQQFLCQKLFECRMAIPFIYPHRSPDNLVMSLWALKTIVVEWRNKDTDKVVEALVTDTNVSRVAFTRLGTPSLSKAKLINDILRDEAHDTFFHRDCPGGSARRRVAEGLVECSWFLPSGTGSDSLPKAVMFLNLRGDGLSCPKQMNVLSAISSTVIVVANAEHLEEPKYLQAFAQVCREAREVVLLATSKPSKQLEPALKKAIGEKAMSTLKRVSGFRKGRIKNASDLKEEMREVVSDIRGLDEKTMEKQAMLAEKVGIVVDESDLECYDGRELALKVVSHLEGKAITECKRQLLPLQGDLWLQYVDQLKMQHRIGDHSSPSSSPNDTVTDKRSQKMKHLRDSQVQICRDLSAFTKEFCDSLTLCNRTPGRLFSSFLHWMQILLDKKCRLSLTGLRAKYKETWAEFQKAKSDKNTAEAEIQQKKLSEVDQKLVEASLGLEHLFRELGQMYEAVTESKVKDETTTTQLVNSLPTIVAKLLLQGHPLELLDGDASNVPITWIKAVLASLANILGKKKLFVLSVLGVQSSGKSTLLNTMFGLRFPVSAGRCTRGAFMQLVPLNTELQQGYDYIVVVDTEGLRAAQQEEQKFDHDNALATLAIGLGDATIINIKGENTAEISDVLQIVVQAFMRMKKAHKHLNTNQACVFIHQNVSAIGAKEKVSHERHKLQKKLDFMTKEAAHQEKVDYGSFSEIIKFDVEKHVWYFPDLWRGSPPMAPANAEYTLCTETVKTTLLGNLIKTQTTRLTTSDLSVRIKDLWNGILSEDFVFSFRNSLEVKAYNAVQTAYNKLEWEFQKSITAWIQYCAEGKIKNCKSSEDLTTCCQTQVNDLSAQIAKERDASEKYLVIYFRTSEWQDIVIQWKEAKMNALSIAADRMRRDNEEYLRQLCKEHKNAVLQRDTLNQRKACIMDEAVKLADELRGGKKEECYLEQRFNDMWKPMIAQLVGNDRPDHSNKITNTLKQSLWNLFCDSHAVLNTELERNPLNLPFPHDTLEGSMTLDDVSNDDLKVRNSLWQKLEADGSRLKTADPMKKARQEVLSITNGIYRKVDMYFKDLKSRDVRFFESQALDILHMLLKGIGDDHASQARGFDIVPTYSVKLAVNICRYSIPAFCTMEQEHEKKHGMRAKLEAEKRTARHLFINALKQCKEEEIFADLFCDQLWGDVTKAVERKVENRVVDEVLNEFSFIKWHLMIAIMKDLAEKDDFKAFISYISDAETYAFEWITDYTNRKLFTVPNYKEWSQYYLGNFVSSITEAVQHASTEAKTNKAKTNKRKKTHSLEQWIDTVCKALQEKNSGIIVTEKSFVHTAGKNAANLDHLQKIVCEKLHVMEERLTDQLQQQDGSSVKWSASTPHQRIKDKLWGCKEKCPFCAEPCSDTTNHYPGSPHKCIQHRPQGIRGIHWYETTDFVPETCNHSLHRGSRHHCDVSNYACRKSGECKTTGDDWTWHSYRDYKKYFKEWEIAPCATVDCTKYWMWFTAKYRTRLEEYYKLNFDIPHSWKDLSEQEALDSLNEYS